MLALLKFILVLTSACPLFCPTDYRPSLASLLTYLSFSSSFSQQSNRLTSALGTVRAAEHAGGVLSATLTREHLALTAEFLKGDE